MKLTLEFPDPLFRKAQAVAARRGQSLEEFVTAAVRVRLVTQRNVPSADEPKWMRGFGKLKRLRKETARVQAIVDGA